MNNSPNRILVWVCLANAAILGAATGESRIPTRIESAHRGAGSAAHTVTASTTSTVDPLAVSTLSEVSAKHAAEIRRRIEGVVNDAARINALDELIGGLSNANRDRIAERPFKEYDKLNAAIEAFREHFKAAVGRNFEFKSAMFDDLKIYEGYDQYHADAHLGSRLKADAGWRPDASSPVRSDLLGSPGQPYGLTGEEKDLADNASEIKEALPGELHDITLNFVNEGVMSSDWRLQLQNPSAEAIATSLMRHLTILAHTTLPKDSLAAHRLAAHHLLVALVDSHAAPKVAAGN